MKKIIIAVCGFAIAMSCSAAAVNWGSGAVYKASDITAKVGKGATDYLVTINFFTDQAGTTAVAGLTGDLSASTAGTGSKYSGTADGFAANSTYYGQIVITTSGYEAKSAIYAFTTPANGNVSLDFSDGTGFNTAFTFSTSTPGTWQSTAAPEPTSGLLLLLGMAGLALKRKKA